MSLAFEALLEYAFWMTGGRSRAHGLVRRILEREPGAPFERLFRRLQEALEQEPSGPDDAARLVTLESVLDADVEAPVGLGLPMAGGDRRRLQVLRWTMKRTCLMWTLQSLPMRPRAVWVLMTRIGADLERAAELLGLHEREAEDAWVHAWDLLQSRLQRRCEHVVPGNPCRCAERLGPALQSGMVQEVSPRFPEHDHDALGELLLDELYSSLPTRDLARTAARAEDEPSGGTRRR